MKMYKVIQKFIQDENANKMEISAERPASAKVKAWRALQKYKKETGIDPEIAISLNEKSIFLTKECYDVTFYAKDGSELVREI